jgi:hypothetical protein
MTNQFLELLNPNAYFGFFSHNSCEPNFQVKTEFLSLFEQACLQGNLESIKSLISNQDQIKNESKFLNGILLTIKFNHLDVFQYLIYLEHSKGIIQRHIMGIRNAILSEGKIIFLSKLEQLFLRENDESTTIPKNDLAQISINTALEELWAYYHSQLRARSLHDHLKALRKKLSTYYRAFHIEPLPIDFESFSFIRTKYSTPEQQAMLKVYSKNAMHRAWRLLNADEEWFESSLDNKLAKDLIPYQWLIVLMWLAANDPLISIPNNPITTVDERLKMFFERLGLIHTQLNLPKQLLLCVLAHPLTKLLTKDILMLEQEKFIKTSLQEQIKLLSLEQLQQLTHEFKTNTINQSALEQHIKFDESSFLCFHKEMTYKWKSQWTKNTFMQEYSRSILLNTSNLLTEYQKTILETFQQVSLYDQSRIQSLGFFQSNKIKSTNPITKDFLFPLS